MLEKDLEFDQIKKTRKDKTETACSVKRSRHGGCGICGSENVLGQGVKYCQMCGIEVDIISDYSDFWWRRRESENGPSCNCIQENKIGNKIYKFSPIRSKIIYKCADCGSVQGPFCPNCRKLKSGSKLCWKHWDGRLFCQHCGFLKEKD